ncbi:universal stress protein [Mycobacterium antarcticum]|uniref:universal stress protein n=1 Tax=Mycolicibacterium sp. TUM20984 TaxID=3023368 RepID=UPI0024E19403|nr:universal stress protein [Mycolicibacterium sp. TUM20984]
MVVGIDGSASAIRAAEWAVDEAVSRDSALRLIHVIEPGSEAVRLETEYAETALRTARAAVDAIEKRLAVETIILRGHIDSVLVEESRHAEMICVGSFGLGYPTGKLLGSVAAFLAKSAHCPVTVVRTPNVRWPDGRWDRRIAGWQRRYPDVDVDSVAVRTSLAETDLTVPLAIADTTCGDAARRLVGPGRTLDNSSRRETAVR